MKVPLSPEFSARLVLFARNGRWGTCIDCPRDNSGNVIPELCKNTDRDDHHLTFDSIIEAYNNYFKHDSREFHVETRVHAFERSPR